MIKVYWEFLTLGGAPARLRVVELQFRAQRSRFRVQAWVRGTTHGFRLDSSSLHPAKPSTGLRVDENIKVDYEASSLCRQLASRSKLSVKASPEGPSGVYRV